MIEALKALLMGRSLYLLIGAMALASLGTWQIASWRFDAQRVVAMERLIEEHNRQRDTDLELAFAASEAKERVRIVYRDLREAADELEDPVDCTAPPGFVELWNSAATGTGPATPRGLSLTVR